MRKLAKVVRTAIFQKKTQLFDIAKFWLNGMLQRRTGTLVYVGLNRCGEFEQVFRKYKQSIAIEANPHLAKKAKLKYLLFYPHVKIIHAAAATQNGKIKLNISSNNGDSSSLGEFNIDWPHREISMIESIEVPAINLSDMLTKMQVGFIDEYISDIQGMDYSVLETMTTWIEQRKIAQITCEVTKDGFHNIYKDLPTNEFSHFNSLLQKNYCLSAKGWGLLEDGNFQEVPEEWWEFDARWSLKKD